WAKYAGRCRDTVNLYLKAWVETKLFTSTERRRGSGFRSTNAYQMAEAARVHEDAEGIVAYLEHALTEWHNWPRVESESDSIVRSDSLVRSDIESDSGSDSRTKESLRPLSLKGREEVEVEV